MRPAGELVIPESAARITYIGGCQRSGSTLLDRMLSRLPDHLSAGEVVHLWTRGLRSNELCGCGAAFLDCPFWTDVGREAFGGWSRLDPDEVVRLQRRVDRNRYIIFMVMPWLWPRYSRDLRAYTDILARLYGAIRAVGDGSIVVDSSKHPSTAFLLRRVPRIQIRILHLVRDSRGVAFSLLKEVRRPEVVGRDELMHRASAWRSSLGWVAFNGLFHLIRTLRVPVELVRYEDLIRRPEDVLRRIADHEGSTGVAGHLGFLDGRRVTLGVDHMVAGNPMRFERGSFDLRVDDAWAHSMGRGDRLVTTLLTWPQLRRYGYRASAERAG